MGAGCGASNAASPTSGRRRSGAGGPRAVERRVDLPLPAAPSGCGHGRRPGVRPEAAPRRLASAPAPTSAFRPREVSDSGSAAPSESSSQYRQRRSSRWSATAPTCSVCRRGPPRGGGRGPAGALDRGQQPRLGSGQGAGPAGPSRRRRGRRRRLSVHPLRMRRALRAAGACLRRCGETVGTAAALPGALERALRVVRDEKRQVLLAVECGEPSFRL